MLPSYNLSLIQLNYRIVGTRPMNLPMLTTAECERTNREDVEYLWKFEFDINEIMPLEYSNQG